MTRSRHKLDSTTFDQVRTPFGRRMTPTGAYFLQPMRVDLLRKPE